ncbi:MAG: beta-phosphoglucomutase family hydrolase [Dactylosporangium sp.]|nr:beta-phosphoglucomutase family hydrolase [Dactylosporangium sp.]
MLGLPNHITACLFDLDGVLTPTATVHAAAWKELFDEVLRRRADRDGMLFIPFDTGNDYHKYVDGKARVDGARSFLESRQISLPEGRPGDSPDVETVEGLAARKDHYFTTRLRRAGVRPYPDAVRYLAAAKSAGLRRGVVSSSRHCEEVLRTSGIDVFVEEHVDGMVAMRERLPGKPAPDTFLAAAERLGVAPEKAAVFEDALAGIDAGRAGGFGCVVAVARGGAADELLAHGADIAVNNLEELLG